MRLSVVRGNIGDFTAFKDKVSIQAGLLMKTVVSVKQDERLGGAEVIVRAPGFQNFGQRLGELENEALAAADPDDPGLEMSEPVAATTPEEREQAKLELNRLLSTMDGPGAEMMATMAKNLGVPMDTFKNLAQMAQDALEDDDTESCDDCEYDLEQLHVEVPPGVKWDEKSEARLDQFLADWPRLRPAVLEETFRLYQEIYPAVAEFYEADPGREIILPKPQTAESIKDLFCIENVVLNSDGSVGLSGPCTWDEDHGFGVRIKDDKVVAVGGITDSFQ